MEGTVATCRQFDHTERLSFPHRLTRRDLFKELFDV